MDSIQKLLTPEVKNIITQDLLNKRIVFLGESEHHIGSDFLAKTEFVKYLVTEHQYQNIAFESDFFALYFEHEQKNTFPFWSKSVQCEELFKFLKEHNVVIWGFDNQFSTPFTFATFSKQLFSFLQQNDIVIEERFKNLVAVVMKNGSEIDKILSQNDVDYITAQIDNLLKDSRVLSNAEWNQFMQSFKSTVIQYTSSKKMGKQLRDSQMAKNLNFLTERLPNDKFMVWAANAHISKLNEDYMEYQNMGYLYNQLNPGITYHIAFAPIKMPYRTDKFIKSQQKNKNNLLSLLPDTDHNYFINSQLFIEANPLDKDKSFEGMFGTGMGNGNTVWFKHFDALVFIANGEKVKYP
ncbi:erythromycin esterase family protein [Flavobacterium paronense]|uniref:erythromycin esterase family protein n=1 Tax=Flavobacterium paronense TaxID=1392775 RepID=UPI0025B2DED1|nr:erythromycin esterase family protein [Flavobacterium paronense]MDN3677101.1 erythromycin esterase family protein [Flavobacterium paronense]